MDLLKGFFWAIPRSKRWHHNACLPNPIGPDQEKKTGFKTLMWRHLPNMKWTHKQQDKAGIWCGSCANQQALAVVIIPLIAKMNKYIWAASCPHIDDKLRTSSDKFVSPAHMMTSSCVSADIAILEHSFARGSWVLQISTVEQPSSCERSVTLSRNRSS